MNELQKEFYAVFGSTAIQFARIEQLTGLIIFRLLAREGSELKSKVQTNTFSKNLNLFQKITKFDGVDKDKLMALIKRLSELRQQRNLFVHGIWFEPHNVNGDTQITCSDIDEATIQERGNGWMNQLHYTFSLDDFKTLIEELKEIQEVQSQIIDQIKKSWTN